MFQRFPLFVALGVIAITMLAHGALARNSQPLTVVELYTSQGCSSCPPADAYLGELAERSERENLLALSFHVDYWNYLGWEDPYSDAAYSRRQSDYARHFNTRNVYTPQMVIQGVHQVVGSNRSEVTRAIGAARSLPRLEMTLSRDGDATVLSLPAAVNDDDAQVFMVIYDNEHLTTVKRGENRGKKMRNRNVVRSIEKIGDWRGKAKRINVPHAGVTGDGGAILVQSASTGAILGAATFKLD